MRLPLVAIGLTTAGALVYTCPESELTTSATGSNAPKPTDSESYEVSSADGLSPSIYTEVGGGSVNGCSASDVRSFHCPAPGEILEENGLQNLKISPPTESPCPGAQLNPSLDSGALHAAYLRLVQHFKQRSPPDSPGSQQVGKDVANWRPF